MYCNEFRDLLTSLDTNYLITDWVSTGIGLGILKTYTMKYIGSSKVYTFIIPRTLPL